MADVLPDGTRVLVRPLLPSDRDELAAGYVHLSAESRHLRFFLPPEELTDEDLDRLTNLDYRDRFAWAAFALDDPGRPGIAVARYSRDPVRPDTAEVAVTVADAYQHRGLGTLLVYRLADVALANGIRMFVSYVLWEHVHLLDVLRTRGARVVSDEPGIARVEFDLPLPAGAAPSGARDDRALVCAGLAPHVIEKHRDLGGEAAGPETQLEQRPGRHEPAMGKLRDERVGVAEGVDEVGAVGEDERRHLDGLTLLEGRRDGSEEDAVEDGGELGRVVGRGVDEGVERSEPAAR